VYLPPDKTASQPTHLIVSQAFPSQQVDEPSSLMPKNAHPKPEHSQLLHKPCHDDQAAGSEDHTAAAKQSHLAQVTAQQTHCRVEKGKNTKIVMLTSARSKKLGNPFHGGPEHCM